MGNNFKPTVSIERFAAYLDNNLDPQDMQIVSMQVELNDDLAEIVQIGEECDRQINEEYLITDEIMNVNDFELPQVNGLAGSLFEDVLMNEIQKVYIKHTLDLNSYNSYFEIRGRCGRIYSDLSALNQKYGVSTSIGEYDHYLAYCIAGWLKDNKTNLSFIRNKSQKELAHDITNQILDYLHVYSLC